jgi:hypothetical protein
MTPPKFLIVALLTLVSGRACLAQDSIRSTYPKIGGYFGIIHPLASIDKEKTTINFRDSYTVGFPTGINIYKSDKIGFSFEVVPFIVVQNGTSEPANFFFTLA